MTRLEQLEILTISMIERFMDVPDTAVLGASAYSDLIKEMNTYKGHFPPSSSGFNSIEVYTSCGNLKIVMSNFVAPDHVSVGTIELETMKLLNTVDKLVFKRFPLFGPSF